MLQLEKQETDQRHSLGLLMLSRNSSQHKSSTIRRKESTNESPWTLCWNSLDIESIWSERTRNLLRRVELEVPQYRPICGCLDFNGSRHHWKVWKTRCHLGFTWLHNIFSLWTCKTSRANHFQSSDSICEVLWWVQSSSHQAHPWPRSQALFHWESKRCHAKDGLDTRPSSIHRDILPIWRQETKANGHLDESSQSQISSTMQTKVSMSWVCTKRNEQNGNTIAQEQNRKVKDSQWPLFSHRRYMWDALKPPSKWRWPWDSLRQSHALTFTHPKT